MLSGFVKVHRQMMKWTWYKDNNTKALFLHLLLSANHSNATWKGIQVKAGQLITSLDHLSDETGMGRQVVRTCMKRLKSTQEITYESTHQYTVVTLLNWHLFQDSFKEPNTLSNTDSNLQLTHDQHTTNTQLTLNKNDKKENKDKKEEEPTRYSEFVESYPDNPHGPGYSTISYGKARKEVSQDRLILSAKLYCNKCAERGTEPKYVKSITKFLSEKMYESILEEWDNDERRRIRDAQPDLIDPLAANWKEGDVLAPQEEINRVMAIMDGMVANGHF